MEAWLRHSERSDMLITAGDLIPQLWFWADRPHTIHLYHYLEVDRNSADRFRHLRAEIDRFICEGHAVIFAPEIADNFGQSFLRWLDLSRDDLRTFFDTYERQRYFTYNQAGTGEETPVYRLINESACSS